MASEKEDLLRGREYIKNLSMGINPVTGEVLEPDNFINDKKISSCLEFVLLWIDEFSKIKEWEAKNPIKEAFNLSPEVIASIKPETIPVSITPLVKKINSFADKDIYAPLSIASVRDWLISKNILFCQNPNDASTKLPTEEGRRLGIFLNRNKLVYTTEAQQFIFNHLPEIIEFNRENYPYVCIPKTKVFPDKYTSHSNGRQ